MKRFSDNYPDITPPNLISGGYAFDGGVAFDGSPRNAEDAWDYFLAAVFGDVEALARIHTGNTHVSVEVNYETPLTMAVRNGRTDAVRFLLEAEGDDFENEGCIDIAKHRGSDEIRAMLVEARERAGAHARSDAAHGIDETLKAPLTEGDVATVKRLLAEKPELIAASRDDQTQYLQWAYETEASDKQVELVGLLIDGGVDPNSGPLIHTASDANNVPLVKLLLEKGADPNTAVDSEGSCMLIAQYRNPNDCHEIHELLASYGGRIQLNYIENEDERPAADQLFAADEKHQQMWYASGEFLWTVLQSDNVAVLDRFVEHFGNQQVKKMSKQKHWFHIPSITLLNRLVEHGMNVNQRDWQGRSFIFDGNRERLQRYIELGADLNVVEFMDCSTRLGYAASKNDLEIARFLLENGADPNLPTEHEWARPLAWAENNDHTEMIELLKS